ncbi:AAA family ATPase [Thermospira aquatica]|uniref:AAA family ATPase n=1 Tax=Thermospira aquatica TaxID=2828656 RepID=A0AAX3BEP4_9SPIR|nr:AAA family ATPase [Thermospira aquatica]URA10524.1 AAA family ATPase [Thermospira aquatica]
MTVFEENELTKFRQEVQNFLAEAKRRDPTMSQARLARMSDVSPATLSAVLTGKYAGNIADVTKKILSVIEREKDKQSNEIKKVHFVETSIFHQMCTAMNIAQLDSQIIVFTGDAGIGKTESIRVYLEENPSSILIEADPCYGVMSVLEEIADALGFEAKGRKDKIEREIIRRLKGSNRLIIVDESEYLPSKALDILRRIHDKAGIPLVLVGMPRLVKNIIGTGDKYRQISSRMYHIRLPGINVEDVRLISETVIDDVSEEMVKLLFTLCKANARLLSKILHMAQRIAIYNQMAINTAILKKASEQLMEA